MVKASFGDRGEVNSNTLPSLYFDLFSKKLGMDRINTIPQIFETKSLPLVTLAKTSGEEKIIAMLELFIWSLNKFLDYNRQMNSQNIRETAVYIYQTYRQLTIADILFVFRSARIGRYGEIIALNGQKIMTWFSLHFDERCRIAAEESMKEHHNLTLDRHSRSHASEKVSERVSQIREANRKFIEQNQNQHV
jgi:hypothetical protein